MDGVYKAINRWSEDLGLGLEFNSIYEVLGTAGILMAVGWFAMHLIFD